MGNQKIYEHEKIEGNGSRGFSRIKNGLEDMKAVYKPPPHTFERKMYFNEPLHYFFKSNSEILWVGSMEDVV